MNSLAAETGGFNRYAIPNFEIRDIGPGLDNCASRLVAQHLWLLDKTVADPTMGVRMQL